MEPQREQHADIVSLHGQVQLKQPGDPDISGGEDTADVCELHVHGQHEKQHARRDTHPGGQQVEQLLTKPEQDHADTEEVKYPEHDSTAREERHYERHHHSDEEALGAALYII